MHFDAFPLSRADCNTTVLAIRARKLVVVTAHGQTARPPNEYILLQRDVTALFSLSKVLH